MSCSIHPYLSPTTINIPRSSSPSRRYYTRVRTCIRTGETHRLFQILNVRENQHYWSSNIHPPSMDKRCRHINSECPSPQVDGLRLHRAFFPFPFGGRYDRGKWTAHRNTDTLRALSKSPRKHTLPHAAHPLLPSTDTVSSSAPSGFEIPPEMAYRIQT